MPGGYWLWPARIAATAASSTSAGPSSSGKPWPRLIDAGGDGQRRHLGEDRGAEALHAARGTARIHGDVRLVGIALSRSHEAQPDVTARVVAVEVDEHDALPHAEQRLAVVDRQHEARGHDRRQHVVGPVAGRAVRVAVAIVAREQALERVDEVVVGARAGLDDGDARGRVRREHVARGRRRAGGRRHAPDR